MENSSLGLQSFSAIIVTGDVDTWDHHRFPMVKRQWITEALQDAATRAKLRWEAATLLEMQRSNIDSLVDWAKANALEQVAAIRPEIGPLNDSLPQLRAALSQAGVRLILIDCPQDFSIRHFATGGFFQFWERVRKTIIATSAEGESPMPQQLSLDFPR